MRVVSYYNIRSGINQSVSHIPLHHRGTVNVFISPMQSKDFQIRFPVRHLI